MIYRVTTTLLVAFLIGHINAEFPCTSYTGDVTFIIDESEVARTKSTTPGITNSIEYFDILRNQLRQFVANLATEQRNGVPVDVRIRILGYTGFGTADRSDATLTLDQFYPGQTNVFDTPAQLQTRLESHRRGNSVFPDEILTKSGASLGGSWTNKGLQYADINLPIMSVRRNIVTLISAQGTFSTPKRTESKAAADSMKNKGWRFFVIGVNNLTEPAFMDFTELRDQVAGDPTRFININSYNDLNETLKTQIKQSTNFLCDTTTTTTTTTTPRPSGQHPCDCALESGTYTIPDDSTCHRFWICDKKDSVYYMSQFDCGPGTLFSTVTHNCVEPENYNCPAWGGKCLMGQALTLYPHLCCAKYWECRNGTVTPRVCPNGQYFDNTNKICRVPDNTNQCLSNVLCSAGSTECHHAPVPGDACSFLVMDNPGGPIKKPCQPGNAYNNNTCVCSDMAPASCNVNVVPGAGMVNPTRDNNNCKALVHLDMTKSALNSRTLTVLNDYTNTQRTDVWVDTGRGTTVENGVASFTGRAKTDASSYGVIYDLLFVPYFADRSFPPSWAMSLDFHFRPTADRLEYVLLTNDNCLQCNATFRLTATRTSTTSNVWDFKFWVLTGDKADKTTNAKWVNKVEASITARVTITNNDQWSKVVVKVQSPNPELVNTAGYRATLSGTVSTPSSSGTSNTQQAFTTAQLMHTVVFNECGLSLGQGRDGPPGSQTTVAFNGEFDDFKFYDCSDVSTLV